LLVVGFFKLSKLPFKFPHLFSSSYNKETIALNDQLKTKIKSIKFQILNKGNKESQLTRMHAKLRKSNNVNQLNQVNTTAAPGILSSLCLDGSCLYLPRVGQAAPTIAQFSDSISNLSGAPSTSTKNISPAFNVQTQYV
jgi:hypothetical protein